VTTWVGLTVSGLVTICCPALFRLIEPAEGSIIIDDVTTTTIGLHDLRQKITILPQVIKKKAKNITLSKQFQTGDLL
jgi:ABC-type multidrug transport system fused ATPase/permease subunit